MSAEESRKGLLDQPYKEFVTSSLPLYNGPIVKIRIGTARYEVSKALLCTHSPYFAAMFNGDFKEGEEQSAALEEVEGVVSVRSFELFLQWLYLGRIAFGEEEGPEDRISAAIEFARLADMLGIVNVELQIAEHIRTTVLDNPPPNDDGYSRNSDTNVYHITSQHVYSATRLPDRHSVRILIANAAIEGYLRSEVFKFHKELRDAPEFAADLLVALKFPLQNVTVEHSAPMFKDPFSGEKLPLRRQNRR